MIFTINSKFNGNGNILLLIGMFSVFNHNKKIYLKSNIQCNKHDEFSGLYTIWLYNFKQYDHNQILNELVILHYCIH